jgi:murein DD-endopeptidase MepM/ murein hydrolase activator NlpD
MKEKSGGRLAISQKHRGRILRLAAAALLILSGCQAAPVLDWSESSSPSQTVSVPASDPVSLPEVLEVTVAGQTLSLLPGEESACTVTLPQALPVLGDDAVPVQIFFEDTQVFSGSAGELAGFLPAKNGLYRYVFDTKEGACSLDVQTDFAPQLVWKEGQIALGEVLPLSVRYTDAEAVTAETGLSFQPVFYRSENGWEALLPIHWNTKPGDYPLVVQAGSAQFQLTVTVADRAFEIQNLTVDETTTSQTVENDDANAEWNRLIEPLKAISDDEQYWSGNFIQPVEGEITTQYGMIRYVNGSAISTRHSGVDLAADRGTPVQAAGSGRVLFAGYLQLTGNTVLIEHGYGLKTWYYHMDSLNVSSNEMVEGGKIIGEVGSTGFSTGPHLHFAMSVNRVFVNPWTAVEEGIGWEGENQ